MRKQPRNLPSRHERCGGHFTQNGRQAHQRRRRYFRVCRCRHRFGQLLGVRRAAEPRAVPLAMRVVRRGAALHGAAAGLLFARAPARCVRRRRAALGVHWRLVVHVRFSGVATVYATKALLTRRRE